MGVGVAGVINGRTGRVLSYSGGRYRLPSSFRRIISVPVFHAIFVLDR